MKIGILFLSLVTSVAMAEVSNIDVTKSPDGKTVVCSSDSHVGRTGYRPLITTLQVVDTDIRFNTGIASLICAKKTDRFGFDSVRLGAPSRGRDANGDLTTETFSDLRFVMINSHYNVIAQSDAVGEIVQTLDYTIPVQKAFSAGELARLKNGETIHARWEFFLQGLHAIQTRAENIPLGLFTGGSFYLNFDISQDSAGTIKIHNFRMN